MSANWERVRNGRIGAMTTNEDKFMKMSTLAELMGVQAVLEWLRPPPGVEELVLDDPKAVIIDKLYGQSRAIEETPEWKEQRRSGKLLDFVVSMDVLTVAELAGLAVDQRVMKKPEGDESALTAFTEFFAMCMDEMKVQGLKDLTIKYYLLQAIAPVDAIKGRVITEEVTAEWDKVELTFSLALVEMLADPDEIKKLGEQTELSKILGNDTIRGFRIQSLIPLIAQIAAMRGQDDLYLILDYGDVNEHIMIDRDCDLDHEMKVGREDEDQIVRMSINEFMGYAVKNITPRLLHKLFFRPGRGKKKKKA